VLVSEGSASASEIVAGALQDYDRAVLMGKRTFGKGLVQTTRPLAYNTQLKVTTAKYHIPSGRCIQALDYAHRKDDGTVERFADSLKTEFRTSRGRKVYDGGGLDPDIAVEPAYLGSVTSALINSGLVFEFAAQYCAEHPAKPALTSFHLSDDDYAKFLKFLKENKFTYATPLERDARQLIETAKKERYYDAMEEQLSNLKSKIEESKATDLMKFRDEITAVVEEQIAFNYDLNEGQAQVSLSRDKTILEARKLLNDSAAYAQILTPR
jgi:carboxyl-terminal processing protease